MHRDIGWLYFAAGLTVASAGLALALTPQISGLLPALRILPAWMAAAVLVGALGLYGTMAYERVASPFAAIVKLWREERGRVIGALAILLLAGLNMIAFMWMKTLLNYQVPFWADPLLARADATLFLGHDPWRLAAPLVFEHAGKVYHPIWFVMMITLVAVAAWARPSAKRSAVLVSYFVLWSMAGPVIHCLLPAGGPIFFEALGHGRRFADIVPTAETAQVAGYLWTIYSSEAFGTGAGISAMPSLHVTMAAWMVLASLALAPRLLMPVAVGASVVAFLSVALGWHYAVDGIVGALVAVGTYRAALSWFNRQKARSAGERLAYR